MMVSYALIVDILSMEALDTSLAKVQFSMLVISRLGYMKLLIFDTARDRFC